MPTPVENYIFNELPRRFVADSSLATGSSLTASWLLVATGSGFQVNLVNPATLGFEPELTAGNDTQYYRGDKTWATLNAAAVGAIASSEKGVALGVATLDADGYVELSQINPAVIERVVVVADEAARYALTTAQVQNGDVVNQQLDGNNDPKPSMWFVYDDTNLNNSSGYLPFSAGVAASVQWSGVSGKPAIIGDLEAITNPNDTDILWFQGGSLVVTDIGTLKNELALGVFDIDGLQDALDGKQDQAEILDRLSELPAQVNKFGILVRDTDGYFQGREVVGTNGITVTEGDGNADNPSIGLTEVGTAGTYGDDDNFPVYEVNAYGQVTGTTTKSLVKDILTLLDQVADQTLVANTTYEIGEYTNTLNLLMPDPVPGGTTVTLAVPMILAAPVGDITVVFPTGKELFGFVPSIPLKATLDPLPGDKIVFTYSSNASKWVFYKTQSLYQKRLYLVGTSSSNPTLDPYIHHSFISNATTNRSISIPDTDIDLSAVGQTEFFTSEFVLKDPTTPTKEIGFNASQISGGQTRIISMPDADVDLGLVGQTDFLDTAFRISDNTDSTKKIAFEASGIATGQTRTITMPNADVDLGAIGVTKVYTAGVPYRIGELVYHQNKTWRVLIAHTGAIPFVNGNLELVGDVLDVTLLAGSAYTAQRLGALVPYLNAVDKTLVITITVASDVTIDISEAPLKVIILNRYPSLNKKVTITKTHASNAVEFLNDSGVNITTTAVGLTSTYDINLAPGGELEITSSGDYQVVVSLRKQNAIGRFKLSDPSGTLYADRNSGWLFNGSATDARTITLPNANVNLGNVAQAASTSTTGYLTSADWNTFNNKEQGGYITVSSNFTAEVGKKYRTVRGLSSAITITPPVTTVDGAYFTVFYTYMTSTGSVTCTNPNISAGPKDAWQEYEYTYDAAGGNWMNLRKSLGPIVPTGSSFQLVNPTTPDAKFTIQAPTIAGLYTLTMPNSNVDLGLVGKTDFLDTAFRVSDNTDSTKKIAFEASGIATGQVRTITMPDVDVDLGQVGVLNSIKITPVDSGSITLQSNKLYLTLVPSVGISSFTFTLQSTPVNGDVIEIHDTIGAFSGTTNLIFRADKNFTFPIGVTGSVSGSAPNIQWADTRRATAKRWKFTYFSDYGGFWRVEEFDTGGCRSPELSIMRKANLSAGVVPNIDAVSGTNKTITYPNRDVDLGNVAQAATGSTNGYLSSTDWNTFNGKLSPSDLRYNFISYTSSTAYTIPASAVTEGGRTIIELSSSLLTNIYVANTTSAAKSIGDSVHVSVTGAITAPVTLGGSGATLEGDPIFSFQYQTKTLIYKGSNVWKIIG